MECTVCNVSSLAGNHKGFVVVPNDASETGFMQALQLAVHDTFGQHVHVATCDPPRATLKHTTQVTVVQSRMIHVHVGACASGSYAFFWHGDFSADKRLAEVYWHLRDVRGVGQRDSDGVAECIWSNIEERTLDGRPMFSHFESGCYAAEDAQIGDFVEDVELYLIFSFDEEQEEGEDEGDEDYFSFRLMSPSQFEEWITGEWTAWPDVGDETAIRHWPKELYDGVWKWIHDIWMM